MKSDEQQWKSASFEDIVKIMKAMDSYEHHINIWKSMKSMQLYETH